MEISLTPLCEAERISPAVWTGRACDARDTYDDLTPISMANASATDLASGTPAPSAIDGRDTTPYYSESKAPSILIDRGKPQEIAALGHLPTRVVRPEVNWKTWKASDTMVTLPVHFAVSVSEDGKSFTEVANGVCRVFGDENIIRFAPTTARYVRFDVLDTVGAYCRLERFKDATASIGNLALFAKK